MQDYFQKHKIKHIDYKDVETLKKILNPSGRILSRKMTRNTAKHQRDVANAVKRARFLALIPYTIK